MPRFSLIGNIEYIMHSFSTISAFAYVVGRTLPLIPICPSLNSKNCEYVVLPGKRDFSEVAKVKDFEKSNHPGL